MSTMEGKPRAEEDHCTIYKRNSSENYNLKLKCGQSVLPFCLYTPLFNCPQT